MIGGIIFIVIIFILIKGYIGISFENFYARGKALCENDIYFYDYRGAIRDVRTGCKMWYHHDTDNHEDVYLSLSNKEMYRIPDSDKRRWNKEKEDIEKFNLENKLKAQEKNEWYYKAKYFDEETHDVEYCHKRVSDDFSIDVIRRGECIYVKEIKYKLVLDVLPDYCSLSYESNKNRTIEVKEMIEEEVEWRKELAIENNHYKCDKDNSIKEWHGISYKYVEKTAEEMTEYAKKVGALL